MGLMTRREVLTAIAQIAAVSSLTACGMSTEDEVLPVSTIDSMSNTDLEILASVAYDLFPHETLTPQLYVNIAAGVLALNDPSVADGLIQLRTAAGETSWLEVEEEQRISVLSSLQGSAFFTLMRNSTIAGLYKTPEGIEFVGYGGSAIELGGYINRGFDDISWLPAQESE